MEWLLREHGPFALKAFAVFASAILVTIMFSQLVGTQGAPADDGDDWRFEESTRRLTVSPGASEAPQVAWSPSGALHVSWADMREGSAGVYHKTSANAGWTFSADRALADGFFSVASPSLAVAPRDGLVGIAWQGRPNASSSEQVFLRASSDDGLAWGRAASVGDGRSPVLAATASRLLLAYVHESVSGDQVRLLTLLVVDDSIRDARALVAFNSSASSLALVATGGRAHLAWAEEALGVTAIAHVSVDLATGVVSPVHLVSANRASSGGVALAGRRDRLALAWSDDSAGTFDIYGAYSGTAGESWITGPPVATGSGNARSPAAAVGARGLVAVVWQDDRTGRSQIFGRIVTVSGTPSTAATRVSDSPSVATEPTVTIGSDRDVIVAWSDARDGETEVYADLDALMDRPRLPTLQTYAKRLAREDFTPPARASRAELLQLLRDADNRIETREESNAIAYLEGRVMPRFDGALGGDPRDDLVVNATAQSEMTRLARGLVDFLRGSSAPGTRTGGGGDGEPNPPPPGDDQGDPPPEPIPGSGNPSGNPPTLSGVGISAITHSSAIVFWNVTTTLPVSSSWADWGIAFVTEHRTYDNATPFQATLTPLATDKTYKVRAGAIQASITYLSDTFSFFSGVKITGLTATNLSSDKATIEWTTNVPATSVVLYGTNQSNLVSTQTAASGTFHQVNLTGLAGGTYYYRARSAALADATLLRESGTFSLQAGLKIFNLMRKSSQVAGYYNVTFTWTTNYQGTSDVRYGLDEKLSSTASGTSGTSHAVTITNLRSSTTYQWLVNSQLVGSTTYACVSSVSNLDFDRNGIDTICTPGESAGVNVSPIRTPPIAIMDVTFTRGQTWVLARWNTTYASNAVVMRWQGTGPKNVTTVSQSTLVHAVNSTGLATATTYKFQLNSTASANGADVARTTAQNVTTKGITIAQTAATPLVTTANISWTTSGPATTIVEYGISYCDNRVTGTDATSPPYGHLLMLSGLRPETTYTYCVRSASLSNLNDIVVDRQNPTTGLLRTFTTMVGPNDANSSTDAGAIFNNALPVEPGRWNGWVNSSYPYLDTSDFYQVYAFPGAQIRATLTVPPTHDLNLYSRTPSNGTSCQSILVGAGIAETITCNVGTNQGYWRIEVRRMTGSNRGAYVLDFTVVGGGPEKFTRDVGVANDQNNVMNTPGISVGTSGWNAPQTSTVPSTALEAYRPPSSPYPNYRQVNANGTFYLNLYRTSAERYNDYLFTLQYYGSQNSNVSAWNGAGWVTIVTVPGQTNWQAFSFTLEHTLFYDAEPTWAGMNVKLRFEKAVQIDLISAIPMKHTTYVGNGSDDDKDEYHMPGIRTFDGWVNQGFGYKNASASGATILVTVPDASAGFMVRLRFDGNSSGFTVQRCTVCSPIATWIFATSTSNYTSGEATFVLDPAWYIDAFSTLPGINAWFRLLPKDRLNQVTQLTLTPVHWGTDVGVTGDNVSANHLPGLSVYPNAEWGPPIVTQSPPTALLPNANGDSVLWTAVGCTEANEWDCLNDDPNDGDVTYLKSTASSVKDSIENLGTVSLNGGTVSNVVVNVWCRKMTSSTVKVRTLIKTNGVLYAGATDFNCPNSASYGLTSTTYTTNPNTGVAWTQTQIDALQAGCRDNDASTLEVRCSEVRVDVTIATSYDGHTARVGIGSPNLYLNLPWPTGSMIAYITYVATAAAPVQLFDGVQWTTVGTITASSTWRTDVLFVQGVAATGGGGPSLSRTFHDDYGDAFVNANLQFLLPPAATMTLDYMWVDVDADGDNLTSFGEPNDYAYADATVWHLAPGQYHDVDWFAPVEGRWQFDTTVRLRGEKDGSTTIYAGLEIAVDGTEIWSGRAGYLPPAAPDTRVASWPAMLCPGSHKLRITGTNDLGGDVNSIGFRKVPTDPDRADTDGDGLRDGAEACAKHTDPTNPDTDADGLTDYDEMYQFFYNNATVVNANVTVNVTVNAASEYQWRVKTSASITGGKPTEAVVYLDGQLKWTKKLSIPWTDVEATFDANLPKGLHSLQVQRSTATGTVTLKLVNVTKPRFTNALFWDTDRDGLSDGDELLGHTGWMLSPTKIDTDGDGALDGDEVRTMHTDPLLPDTDYDGYNDYVDLDPLHDLVVQLRISQFGVSWPGCSPDPCRFWARGTVGPNWTNSVDTAVNGASVTVNHLVSGNVPDNAAATVKVQVFANTIVGGSEFDVAGSGAGPPVSYVTTVTLTGPDRYSQFTSGCGPAPCAWAAFDIRVFRVGKANTLLVAPNDWSTLSNGTVDGTPTGLHRYVGENRFVFVLLNVTDGNGNLVSYDLETKDSNGKYTDLSGNGLHAQHVGDAADRGRFGLGARLDGTANSYIYAYDDPKLDDVNDALTVSFWLRPDEDYLGGTGWRWSTGREGLWRLGYYNDAAGTFHGLRFEVKDTAGNVRGVQTPYALYAGRWVHLAGVLARRDNGGAYWWSELSLHVNGVRLQTETVAAVTAMGGSTHLRIGFDSAPGGGRFKGIVDEFRLYKTTLTDDGVRGLTRFLSGANSVLIPRGVFFDSAMFAALNGAWDSTSPLAGANVYANDNAGAAHLNAQVIQLVMVKNATLAQASAILDLAVRNGTNVVTAFALAIAPEFYTLGLAKEVRDLAANTVVENSGNATAPPPSPEWWEKAWNAVVGFGQWLWNAAVAVAVFFVSVGKWLVDIGIGLYKGLVEQNWTYFKDNVIGPLKKAFEALVQFLIDLVKAVIDGVLHPLKEAAQSLRNLASGTVQSFLNQVATTHPGGVVHTHNENQMATWASGGWQTAFSLVFLVSTFMVGIAVILGIMFDTGLGSLIGALLAILLTVALVGIFGAFFSEPIVAFPGNVLDFAEGVDTSLGTAKYLLSASLAGFGWRPGGLIKVVVKDDPGPLLWALTRAKIAMFVSASVASGIVKGPEACPYKWISLGLAFVSLLYLIDSVIGLVRSTFFSLGMKLVLGLILAIFITMVTISLLGIAGDLSLNCF